MVDLSKSITIDSVRGIIKLLTNYYEDKRINRYRSSYLYRGLPNVDFRLETSLQRNCHDKKGELEKSLLRNFRKYALADNAQGGNSVWSQLTIGQHHGLPTRMLDWTYSPLMALNFAVTESSYASFDDHDCVVWAIDITEMNALLPEKYQEALNKENAFFFTIDMLNKKAPTLKRYDEDMTEIISDGAELKPRARAMVLLEPPSIDQRIINQYSYFSVVPTIMDNIEGFLEEKTKNTKRYIIKKEVRWEIRDLLDTLNINERIVYPGIDGVAAWLKRHYYVK